MDMGLKGSVVLVTGSSRGIGLGIAEGFLEEGARVVITGRDQDSLDDAVGAMAAEYGEENVLGIQADFSSPGDRDTVFARVEERMGGLDHLVCNIGSGKSVPVLSEDTAEFSRMLELNLLTAQGTVAHFLPLLEKRAAEEANCSIVFVSSICGNEVLGCPVAYAAAKSGLNTYAKTIARPLGRKGIRVNSVSPGNVLFPGSTWENKLAENADGVMAMLDSEVPLNRLGTLEEIASVAVFLASERASFVTGASWTVDGGQTRSL